MNEVQNIFKMRGEEGRGSVHEGGLGNPRDCYQGVRSDQTSQAKCDKIDKR